ncbi:MAG: hypothetical protein QOK21_144 [Solirubrobacteraceae bacterium]|jgi:hypothetical protein|nr:hypothetical protein [Solirubrobacteraceae bacterium]
MVKIRDVDAPLPTVLVAGLGDLGGRVLDALSRRPGLGRLVGASRDAERGRALAGQCALVAELAGGPRTVSFEPLDLTAHDDAAETLARVAPDVIVMAASAYTWWRPGAPAGLPYAVWLPLLVPLVAALMRARAAAGVAAPVVSLPFPDVVGPMLATQGLAPQAGAGNVAEVAAKLAACAVARTGAAREEVQVRLVLHHAAERSALGVFERMGSGVDGRPPWAAEVLVRGEPLAAGDVEALFAVPYPTLDGRDAQGLTAAAAVAVVEGLLGDVPVTGHVPAPAGRPGGYPVRLSRGGIELDLPASLPEADAIALNARAASWDGVQGIEADGTVVLTERAAEAARAAFGVELGRMAPGELEALAERLR